MSRLTRIFILLFPLLLGTLCASAQFRWDYGIHVGAANYLGEIGGRDRGARPIWWDMQLNQTRQMVGAFLRYRLNHFAVNGGINYGRIQGSDNLTNYTLRYSRNLSFRNDLIELTAKGEYNFITIRDLGSRGSFQWDLDAYIFLGAAVFYNDPKAQLRGQWYSLRPLQTEGLDKTYSPIQPAIPFGIGSYVTYRRKSSKKTQRNSDRSVRSVHRFGFELGLRYTFTDYLDDISTNFPLQPDELKSDLARELSNRSSEVKDDAQFGLLSHYAPGGIRGNPKNKDFYIFFSLTYGKALKPRKKFSKYTGATPRHQRKWILWKYSNGRSHF